MTLPHGGGREGELSWRRGGESGEGEEEGDGSSPLRAMANFSYFFTRKNAVATEENARNLRKKSWERFTICN